MSRAQWKMNADSIGICYWNRELEMSFPVWDFFGQDLKTFCFGAGSGIMIASCSQSLDCIMLYESFKPFIQDLKLLSFCIQVDLGVLGFVWFHIDLMNCTKKSSHGYFLFLYLNCSLNSFMTFGDRGVSTQITFIRKHYYLQQLALGFDCIG